MTECSIEGCGRDATTREWCSLHYQRWKRHGDPLVGPTSGAIGVHLPFGPLWVRARPESMGALAGRVGVTGRTVHRWKRDGVPMVQADAVACALGLHPSAIWGDGWDGSTAPQAERGSVTA